MKLDSVVAVLEALNHADVRALVVGGVAVNAHGYPRLTQDLDLVLDMAPPVLMRAFEALDSLGYRPGVPVTASRFADPDARARLAAEKGMQVLGFHSDEHPATPVDVFASEPFDFGEEYARALVEEIAPGVEARVVRLKTLLRMKREAGRPQDVADVAELEALHPEAES